MDEYIKLLEKALVDVLDGQHMWYEIQEQTGLPEKRCKEIEFLHLKAARNLNLT